MKLPKIGDVVAERYEVDRVIARGGMGMVYAAKQRPIGRLVAMKVILPDEDRIEKLTGRFRREVELAMKLRHPNVVEIYDFGRDRDGLFYLVMEYLEGVDLKMLLQGSGPLSLGRASEIALQVLDALSEAHAEEIVHRDLKPSNIFITRAGRRTDFVKLLDFGVAKSLGQNATELTQTGQIVGSLHYMSPENFIAEGVNYTADVYAAGLILLEMLLGQRVMQGANTAQLLMLHLNHEIQVPPPFAGTPLQPVILKACARDPDDRYPDAAAFYDALEASLSGLDMNLAVDPTVAPSYVAMLDAEGSDLDHMARSMQRAAEYSSKSGSNPGDAATVAAALLDELDPMEHVKTTLTPSQPASRADVDNPDATLRDDHAPVGVSPSPDDATLAHRLPADDVSTNSATFSTTGLTSEPASKGLPSWAPWAALAVVAVLFIGALAIFFNDPDEPATDLAEDEMVMEVSSDPSEARQKTSDDIDAPEKIEKPEEKAEKPAPVFVRVNSEPGGATVTMGGDKVGQTPVLVQLEGESAALGIEREGYESEQAEISRQDAAEGVTITLEKVPEEKPLSKREAGQTEPKKDPPREDPVKDEEGKGDTNMDDILKIGKFE